MSVLAREEGSLSRIKTLMKRIGLRRTWLLSTFVVAKLSALEFSPWLPEPYQPYLDAHYVYSTFSKVNHAEPSLEKTSHDQLAALDFFVANSSNWEVGVDVEFAHTPRFDWGFRSSGAALRYQLLNDLTGDVIACTPSVAVRVVAPKALHDISTPYHAEFNGELAAAFGREWSAGEFWTTRLSGLLGVGAANRGSPWMRFYGAWESNRENRLRTALYTEGYFGFGNREIVSLSHFDGWASIHHQSVDVGGALRFFVTTSAVVSVEYIRRVYARSFPEQVNFYLLRFSMPLSF